MTDSTINHNKSDIVKTILLSFSAGKIALAVSSQNALADFSTAETERVSVIDKEQAPYFAGASQSVVSGDGRYIAFTSDAIDLISTTEPARYDLYLYDTKTDAMKGFYIENKNPEQIKSGYEVRNISLSSDGRYVAFEAYFFKNFLSPYEDAYILDSHTGEVSALGASGSVDNPVASTLENLRYMVSNTKITQDGQSVVYESRFNEHRGIFVYDIKTRQNTPVNIINLKGQIETDIRDFTFSSDLRYLVFHSYSKDLTTKPVSRTGDIFVHDRLTSVSTQITAPYSATAATGKIKSFSKPSISSDASIITFESTAVDLVEGDTNDHEDIFIYNRLTKSMLRLDLDSIATQAGATLSGDERSSGAGTGDPVLSPDGQVLAFPQKYFFNNNPAQQLNNIFLYDIKKHFLTQISNDLPEVEVFYYPHIKISLSEKGDKVVYPSNSKNLVSDDSNNKTDVFVYNRNRHRTRRVNLNPLDKQANSPKYAFFKSTNSSSAYLFFATSSMTNTLSQDARLIVLSIGPRLNYPVDLFLRDNLNKITHRINFKDIVPDAPAYNISPMSISRDGSSVFFCADDKLFLYNVNNQQFKQLTPEKRVCDGRIQISGNGQNVLYATEKNREYSPFYYYNVGNNKEVVLNANKSYNIFSFSLSSNGRYIVYSGYKRDETPEYNIYLYDLLTQVNERISIGYDGKPAKGGDWGSYQPVVSDNGRFIVYGSTATNLVPDDNNNLADIFLYDRFNGQTKRITLSPSGNETNGLSTSPSISADGRYIAYFSEASNLITKDDNDKGDVFVYDRITGQTIQASVNSQGEQANDYSGSPVISADGKYVSYVSAATNLDKQFKNLGTAIFRTRIVK